jgi:hypothetical protein
MAVSIGPFGERSMAINARFLEKEIEAVVLFCKAWQAVKILFHASPVHISLAEYNKAHRQFSVAAKAKFQNLSP